MGQWLAQMTSIPMFALLALICLVVTFMTEATSNTASTTLLMPVLAAAALAAGIAPELIMVPAVLSASCAFMLPVATALNLMGVVVISASCYVLLA